MASSAESDAPLTDVPFIKAPMPDRGDFPPVTECVAEGRLREVCEALTVALPEVACPCRAYRDWADENGHLWVLVTTGAVPVPGGSRCWFCAAWASDPAAARRCPRATQSARSSQRPQTR